MCGIAGAFAYSERGASISVEALERVRDAMATRGPDGAGLWLSADGKVGLAHRRLSILDLSEAGAQPMSTPDRQCSIVFNGEIYNHRALRTELEAKGHRFRSGSDTEVLLNLYLDRGPDMVRALRGMFAFAIWDERRQGLLVARDPLGIKPMYMADNGATLQFASQVKALLVGDAMDVAPEPAGHVGFFLWGSVPEPYTLYRGIRAFPPGTTLWLERGGRRQIEQFYDLAAELSEASHTRPPTQEEACARLSEALSESVKHHHEADVPVGLFLSAGLDSATLAALSADVLPGAQPLRALTLGFEDYRETEHDETELAKAIARRYGADHAIRWIRRDEFQARLPHLLAAMDQPTVDGINTYFISLMAAEAGLKVALSGLGGDELLGGYPSFRDVPRMARTIGPMGHIPWVGRAVRRVAAPLVKRLTSPKYAGLLEYGSSYGGAYMLRRGLYMPWELPNVLDGDLVREGWRELQPVLRLNETAAPIESDKLKVTGLELSWYTRNQLLRDADWAGMAHSVEIRVPFLDTTLLHQLRPILSTATKQDMASCPPRALPTEILQRPKTGFAVPVHAWMMEGGNGETLSQGLRGWARQVYDAQWKDHHVVDSR